MKKKVATSLMALVVLAAALWLGALAWSRHEVQSRMAERVAEIDDLAGIRAINTIDDDGFFSSRGTLRISASDDDTKAPAAVIDWRIAYGVLNTRLSGQADIDTRDGRALLADELSDNERVTFNARIGHLKQDLRLTAVFPESLHYQAGDMTLRLSGARLGVTDNAQGLHLEGQWAGLEQKSPRRQIHLGDTHWSMLFPGHDNDQQTPVETEDHPGRRDTLEIGSVRLQRQDGLPLALSDLHVEGSTHHADQELSYYLKAQLGNAAFSEQQLGSATLDAELRRINEQAADTLLQTMARDIEQRWKAGSSSEGMADGASRAAADHGQEGAGDTGVHDLASLVVPWQEAFFAVLGDSPRLVINRLQLDSPMLEQQMHLEGELTLNGADIGATRWDRLKTSWGRAAFKRRLDGQFTLHNTPPLLALVAGQAPDQGTLELAIRKGVFLINDEPWFLLN